MSTAPPETTARILLSFELSPVAMALCGPDGHYFSVNSAFCRLIDRAPEEVLGRTYHDFTHPADLPLDHAHEAKAVGGELDTFTLLKRFLRRDGEPVWVELTVTSVRDDSGRIAWSLAHMLDITARRKAAVERQRLAAVVEATEDFVGISTLDGRIEYLNPAARRMVGLERHCDVTELGVRQFQDPAEYERLLELSAETLMRGGVFTGETALRHFETGDPIPAEVHLLALPDLDTGVPARVAAIFRDRREARQAEAALRASESRLSSLVANTSDLVMVVGPDGRVGFVNAAVTPLLGYEPDEVAGEQALDFVHAEDVDEAIDHLMAALAGAPDTKRMEARLARADSEWRWFEVVTSPRFDEPGLTGVVLNCRDIDHRRREEEGAARNARYERFALETSRRALDLDFVDVGAWLPTILEGLGEVLGVDLCFVDQVDEAAGTVRTLGRWSSTRDRGDDAWLRPRRIDEVRRLLDALRVGPIVETDLEASPPEWWAETEAIGPTGDRSLLDVPLVARERLVGALGVATRARHEWAPEEITLLRRVAETVANALERDRAHAELEASEARFRLLADNATDLVSLHDLAGTIRYASPASRSLLGYEPEDLVGVPVFALMHPDDVDDASRGVAEMLTSGNASVTWSLRLRRTDRSYIWVESTVRAVDDPVTGDPTGFQASCRDITARKALEEELLRQARHDPLTGLANRTLLLERLEAAAARRARSRGGFSVLMVDLDGFKQVNDLGGHAAGDDVLKVIADRLNQLVRRTDTVARVGGDEFVVLCTDTDPDHANAVAERVVAVLAEPVVGPWGTAAIGASVGVAHADDALANPEELLRRADLAMYEAKRQGKGHAREA